VQGGNSTLEFWAANVPSGTTANISITWSGGQVRCGAGVWTLVRPKTIQAVDVGTSTAATGANTTLTTATTGVVLAAHYSNDSNSYTWTNVSERYDTGIESTSGHSGADVATSGSNVTPTAAWSGSN